MSDTLRRFLQNAKGNVAVTFVLASLPLMAAVGGAIDYFDAANKASALQNAVDTAALAAAQAHMDGKSASQISQAGQDFLSSNSAGLGLGLNSWTITGTAIDASLPIWSQFSKGGLGTAEFVMAEAEIIHKPILRFAGNWDINRRAIVRVSKGKPACVLALDPTASAAIKVQGSTQNAFVGCVVATNSTSESAFSRGGSAILESECIISSGGVAGLPSPSVKTACEAPLVKQPPTPDPLRNVSPPNYTACEKVPNSNTYTLSPGASPMTFCNEKLKGEITMNPGTYILRGGSVDLGGNGKLTGNGVTIFLMEGAKFSIGANQTVNLSPPTTGPYAGIAVYQAKGNTNTVSFLGTAGSRVSGFIYAPDAHIIYAGNNAMGTPDCLRLVGKTIELTGNSNVGSNCTAQLGGREMYAGRSVAMVR
ncbi:pilus assembly protein [Pseudaminobacter sp. 19-2017]|uniref:Pilus assembly protein n=1 Tax=Pseudaminobacter soli (ex Zhang et al. 2022) TaxID=2831468 RepID=A0A942E1E4_9HYPH|nr:TadE/TadG family type IV pilus assembly protein [Pseudaminobacter soli]MBS3651328.1 pilus assembly protein [Pseudaminobacter soli]